MKKRILFILSLYLIWLLIFALQKPAFMLYNHAMAAGTTLTEWLLVIWNGLKLDLTVAGYLTAIPLIFTLFSIWLPGVWLNKLLKGYYLIIAILVAAFFCIDLGLYEYWGFRLDTTVFFYLNSSIKDALASVPLLPALLLFIVFLVYTYIIYWLFSRLILSWAPETMVRKRITGSFAFVILGGILFILIRGGVTTSTANVGMVYFSQNQFLNHAAINPVFSLMTSISKQQDFASQFNFFPEQECKERFEQLTPPVTSHPYEERLLKTDHPNILLILLESFSANAIEVLGGEAGVTPNLNRLSREGVLFTNMYANSFRTDRGIVSVLNGYLAQPTTSIMKYPAKSQTLPSIAKALGEKGYTADMLYGGDINFTNMQSYFFSSGYSRITADRDFPLSSRLSKWGANDDITFAWLYEDLKKRDTEHTPWLTTFLTLSSHEPFEVPYHRLSHPYLNSVAFTDSCLGHFIDKVKTLPVWDNLLVILVSDHGFRYPQDIQDYDPGRYHIPMLWLGGALKEPGVIDTFANQTDLAATLLNQLNLPHDTFIFSKDILNPAHPHYAFYTFNNGFGFLDPNGYVVFDNEGERPLQSSPSAADQQQINNGKALLQTLYKDMGNR